MFIQHSTGHISVGSTDGLCLAVPSELYTAMFYTLLSSLLSSDFSIQLTPMFTMGDMRISSTSISDQSIKALHTHSFNEPHHITLEENKKWGCLICTDVFLVGIV